MATRWRYAVVVTLCLVTLPLSTQAQETSLVPVLVDGETVRLAMRMYKPVAGNPAPTLVFNHGSTGMGTDPGLFSRPIDAPAVARFFVQRGRTAPSGTSRRRWLRSSRCHSWTAPAW